MATDSERLTTEDIIRLETAHSSGGTARRPIVLSRGNGIHLWDDKGNQYLDLSSSQGWSNIGHCHPKVTRAIQEQAAVYIAQTESSFSPIRAAWYAQLTEILKKALGESEKGCLTRIHACNSGTEAIETAIKVARYFTKRTEIVACKKAFHGRTMGSLSATWNPQYRNPFEPLVPGFSHVSYNDLSASEQITDKTAAFLVETVQGEGGIHPATTDFLMTMQETCRKKGALLIVDEVQTGLGRTGEWFGSCHHRQAGFSPDMMAMGKTIGGGIPMGAVAWRNALGPLEPGSHGSTFGGNPLACAASLATLRVLIEEKLIERASLLGELLKNNLQAMQSPLIREIRQQGLMVGIDLKQKVTPILKELMLRGVWALPAGVNVLRLLPPLIIPEEELWRGLHIIEEVFHVAESH